MYPVTPDMPMTVPAKREANTRLCVKAVGRGSERWDEIGLGRRIRVRNGNLLELKYTLVVSNVISNVCKVGLGCCGRWRCHLSRFLLVIRGLQS
jgi:hypothetical protein